MKYYDDYDLSIIGTEQIINIKGRYSDSDINLNRTFENDKVIINNDIVVNLIERYKFQISGILAIQSKIRYGNNKKGYPIYLFKPSNKKYPYFYVASSYKSTIMKNVYALVSFHKWDTTQQYPSGICDKVIGEVGDITAEYENILYQYNINYLKHRKYKPHIEYESTDRLDLRNENIFSIARNFS